ncbi:putative reverse transcriptase zinc-binding domain-containing protein [Helianthus annuus]|nr:putative reverse transcriptase zinc-binding domain-containing protein [Helianthus annuus]
MMVSSFPFSSEKDKWVWSNGGKGFSVNAVKIILERAVFCLGSRVCDWVKWIPIKINVFVWRACLNRIPVAVNLIKRGMTMTSEDCVNCHNMAESVVHCLLGCSVARAVWRKVSVWAKWDLTGLEF